MEEMLEMSQGDRDRLKAMSVVITGRRTQREAARLLELTTRQIRRIQRRLEAEGDRGIIHRLRGRPSNARLDPEVRRKVVEIYQRRYQDFGPTLASEKLEAMGHPVSAETLRRWLMEEGLWERRKRRETHRSRRERKACYGEMLQADASHHDWLEGRGNEHLVLIILIDDATSRVTGRFYTAETTEAYMELSHRHIRLHGRPLSIYADRHSIFAVHEKNGIHPGVAWTEFGRALEELEIRLIPAYSPQAKGRVERFFKTAQDRLVKELRLAGAKTLEEANCVLEAFLLEFNRRFAVRPASPNNAHRPVAPSTNLQAILCLQETRRVANDYTVRLDNRIYQIQKPAYPGLRGGTVRIERRRKGDLKIRFKSRYLAFHEVKISVRDVLPVRSVSREAAGNFSRASGRSGRASALPLSRSSAIPSPDHPWRKAFLRPKYKLQHRTFLSRTTGGHFY